MIELDQCFFQETPELPPQSQLLDLPAASLEPNSEAPLSATAPLECDGVSGGASSTGDGNQPSSAAPAHSEDYYHHVTHHVIYDISENQPLNFKCLYIKFSHYLFEQVWLCNCFHCFGLDSHHVSK